MSPPFRMGKKKPKVRWTAVEENFFCSTSCSGDDEDSNGSGNGHANHNGNGEANGEGGVNGASAANGGSYSGGKYGSGGRRFHNGGRREALDSIRTRSLFQMFQIVKDDIE